MNMMIPVVFFRQQVKLKKLNVNEAGQTCQMEKIFCQKCKQKRCFVGQPEPIFTGLAWPATSPILLVIMTEDGKNDIDIIWRNQIGEMKKIWDLKKLLQNIAGVLIQVCQIKAFSIFTSSR